MKRNNDTLKAMIDNYERVPDGALVPYLIGRSLGKLSYFNYAARNCKSMLQIEILNDRDIADMDKEECSRELEEESITEKALRSRFDELFKKVASGYEITKEEREFLLSFF